MTHLQVLAYRTVDGPGDADVEQCTSDLTLARDLLHATLTDWALAEDALEDAPSAEAAAWRALAVQSAHAAAGWSAHAGGMTVELRSCAREHC